jgi:transposase
MIAKGKKVNVVKTAIAREIAGFSWAIAMELPKVA